LFFKTGIDNYHAEVFKNLHKTKKEPRRTSADTNIWDQSNADSDSVETIPGMKEITKEVDSRLSTEAPQNNWNAVLDFMGTMDPHDEP